MTGLEEVVMFLVLILVLGGLVISIMLFIGRGEQ